MKITRIILAAGLAGLAAASLNAQDLEAGKAASGAAFGEAATGRALGNLSGGEEAVVEGSSRGRPLPRTERESGGLGRYGDVPAPPSGAGNTSSQPSDRDKLLTGIDVAVGAGVGGLRFGLMGFLAGGMVGLLYGISRHLDSDNEKAHTVSDTMTGVFGGMMLLGPSGALPGAEAGLIYSAWSRKKKESKRRLRKAPEGDGTDRDVSD